MTLFHGSLEIDANIDKNAFLGMTCPPRQSKEPLAGALVSLG